MTFLLDSSAGQQWLSMCHDAIPGEGEDAPPIVVLYETENEAALLGVFDGLGGAGGRIHETDAGERHSGAYFAARIARAVSLAYFRDNSPQLFDETFDPQGFVEGLQRELLIRLQRHARDLKGGVTRLRGSIISTLPTTVALAYLETNTVTGYLGGLVIWSGDSRAFVLTPDKGLKQITVDDLRVQGDAYDNLIQDSPMSNYASADRPFHHNYRVFSLPLPGIVLAATDGCYHYLPTPMHWEFLLLHTLSQADNTADWKSRIEQALVPVAGDDISLALMATGWDSFESLKHDFAARLAYLTEEYIDPLERFALRRDKESGYEQLSMQLWRRYKRAYEWSLADDSAREVSR